jgi:hypothetical protein
MGMDSTTDTIRDPRSSEFVRFRAFAMLFLNLHHYLDLANAIFWQLRVRVSGQAEDS